MKPFRKILGIMSGTSLDGVDFVLTEFDDGRPRLIGHTYRRFPDGLRRRLHECASGTMPSWDMAQLHHDLGRFYAVAAPSQRAPGIWDAIGVHGQTIFHAPGRKAPATFQLGEPAYLAERFGVAVVSNFRAADLAVGGQGAPMATLFHVRVFGRPKEHVCVQNLGGIGNVTSIDERRRGPPRVRAFDTGPANILINAAMERVSGGRLHQDSGGRLARRGKTHQGSLERWLRHPYFRRPPPKSTGREMFGQKYLEELWAGMDRANLAVADRVATLTEMTARSILLNYDLHLPSKPDRVVLCGGGVRNRFLCDRIKDLLREWHRGIEVLTCDELGWPAETVEGAAFALLARECLLVRPGNVPSATGARKGVVCGQVTDPSRVVMRARRGAVC